MVIFGKKAKALIRRVDELEYDRKILSENLLKARDRIDKIEAALKDLTLTVENSLDNGSPRKSPEQIMNEWLNGADEEDKN